MTQEIKAIAARKAGAKAFRKCRSDKAPVWFTTEGERFAFRMGWWVRADLIPAGA